MNQEEAQDAPTRRKRAVGETQAWPHARYWERANRCNVHRRSVAALSLDFVSECLLTGPAVPYAERDR